MKISPNPSLPKREIIKSPSNKGGLRGIWGAFSGETSVEKEMAA
jgi:hypothetical protein